MSKHILVVEDEAYIRGPYVEVLKGAGYQVTEAEDGEEALDKMSTDIYDLILLDILLPKMDALQVLKKLTSKQAVPKAPIIILTNLANDPVIKELMKLGVSSYLLKVDTNPGQLLEKARKILT